MSNGITVSGLTEVKAALVGLQGDLENVNKFSQNKLAYLVWDAEKKEMQDSFDGGPAPNTVKQIVYQKYKTRNLTTHDGAGVYIKDIFRTGSLAQEDGADRHYLSVMELGGEPAGPKRSVAQMRWAGILRPGYTWAPAKGARLTKAGNISGAKISDMLTSIGIGFVPTEDKKYRLIYDEQQYPIGVAAKKGKGWTPFMWFIEEPTYEGGNFLWSYTGELVVNANWKQTLDFYLTKAIEKHK
jgi:hypothetical protein